MLKFKTTPYQHQIDALNATAEMCYAALLLEMGTGKSKVAIDTAAHLFTEKKINGMLVIAPKTICRNWSEQQIPLHLHDDIKRKIVLWRSPNKTLDKEIAGMFHNVNGHFCIFVVNVETIAGAKCYDIVERFLKEKQVLMVIDESTTIKNRQTERYKAVSKLGRLAKYRRIMTGTPITQSPMDLYSQFEFLQPKCLGHTSFYGFRNQYAILKKRYVNGRSFDEIIGYQRLNHLQQVIKPISYRILKKECLDLPDKLYQVRYIDTSVEQRRIYEQLKTETMALLRNGSLVSAPLMITQILRLRQALCNLTNADGIEQPIDDEYPRIDEIMKILEECDGQKVIIWATFIKNIKDIKKIIIEKYGEDSAAIIAGFTNAINRQNIVELFQQPNSPLKYVIAQPKTGGYGLTLTAATTVIYHDNDWSLQVRQQSEDRCHRIGQNNKVTYIDLVAGGTIDEKIRKVLVDKKELADLVTGDNLKNMLED